MSKTFEKSLNSIKVGIAISTFSESKTCAKRYEIIKRSLDSLEKVIQQTTFNVYVVIVVDGSVPKRHYNILSKYNFIIYQKKQNGGVARTKNTCIRLLLEQNTDIGFLADDDVLYKNNCIDIYNTGNIYNEVEDETTTEHFNQL